MKLTKKIVSLAAVLALSCTFAVSAATFDSTTAAVEVDGDGYKVTVPVATAETNDQYTILVYRIGDNGVFNLETGAVLNAEQYEEDELPVQAAPDSNTITYINQDNFGTLTPDEAYTLAFALGAVNTNGQYKVLVGGTNIALAAVGYFEVGEAAPAYTYGDVNNDGVIDTTDAGWILSKFANSATVFPCGADAAGDVNNDGVIDTTDAGWVLSKFANSSTVFPVEAE